MNGFLVVNKPSGMTSFDVVRKVGKILGTKKIGHTGTLDPLASGVLVLTIGRYTKLCNMLSALEKEYIAEMKLGILTDTLDISGKVIETSDFCINEEDIQNVFHKMIGTYHMQVPIYSAIKINGKKLYEYARKEEKIDLPEKDVQIYELELLDFHDDTIQFRAKVEKGTYIRSLVRDIAKEFNTLGTMSSLKRIKQGAFCIEESFSLEDIEKENFKLLSLEDILPIKKYSMNEAMYHKVINGNELSLDIEEEMVLFTFQEEEIAIYKKNELSYKCYVMLKIK